MKEKEALTEAEKKNTVDYKIYLPYVEGKMVPWKVLFKGHAFQRLTVSLL